MLIDGCHAKIFNVECFPSGTSRYRLSVESAKLPNYLPGKYVIAKFSDKQRKYLSIGNYPKKDGFIEFYIKEPEENTRTNHNKVIELSEPMGTAPLSSLIHKRFITSNFSEWFDII